MKSTTLKHKTKSGDGVAGRWDFFPFNAEVLHLLKPVTTRKINIK